MSAKRQFKKIGEMFTDLDVFTEPIRFTFDKGKTEFTTFMGAIATLIYVSLIIAYSVVKMISMYTFVDSKVQKRIAPNFFNATYQYNTKEFDDTFAFGITAFQDFKPLNADYGSITVKYEQWNATSDESSPPLKTRPCTQADFKRKPTWETSTNTTFYEPHKDKELEFGGMLDAKLLMCID